MPNSRLAIVRAHNSWTRDWTILITLTGWFGMLLGLVRMFAAGAYQQGSARTSSSVFLVLESLLLAVGLILTFQAYRPRPGRPVDTRRAAP